MYPKRGEKFDAILRFINHYVSSRGQSPTLAEIADALGVNKSTVLRNVTEMAKQDIITYEPGRSRGIFVKDKSSVRLVPVVGTVSCGCPVFAEQNIEGYVPISDELCGVGDFFVLRCRGDSMINAGINDGDMVFVRRQESAEQGQIVVALIGEEVTLKRFFYDPQRKQYRLRPENDSMADMYFDDVAIQGVAVKVFKDIV